MSLKIAPKTLTCGFLSKIKENVILKTPETIPLKMVTLYFPLAFIQALSVCIIDKNTTDNDESFNIFIVTILLLSLSAGYKILTANPEKRYTHIAITHEATIVIPTD